MANISASFRKHGTYIYQVPATIADYGNSTQAIEAMKRAQMTHAWVRIHAQKAYPTNQKKVILDFINDAKAAGIVVAGWGWCQGEDPAGDANLAVRELEFYGLHDYIADIENGTHNAKWEADEIVKFCTIVRKGVPGSFGITSYPLIDWHEPELMAAASPFVDMFNPQVYWHHFPNKKMRKQFKRPNGSTYEINNAVEYADLCLDRWDRLTRDDPKPLVLTGQAYWGEGKPPFTQAEAEDKLDEFLGAWTEYNRIIGLNWWHFGGDNAMSHRMLESITAAELGDKVYKS